MKKTLILLLFLINTIHVESKSFDVSVTKSVNDKFKTAPIKSEDIEDKKERDKSLGITTDSTRTQHRGTPRALTLAELEDMKKPANAVGRMISQAHGRRHSPDVLSGVTKDVPMKSVTDKDGLTNFLTISVFDVNDCATGLVRFNGLCIYVDL